MSIPTDDQINEAATFLHLAGTRLLLASFAESEWGREYFYDRAVEYFKNAARELGYAVFEGAAVAPERPEARSAGDEPAASILPFLRGI